MEQRIRFCESADGVKLAYAEHGAGEPLVKTATWMTHLEYDWQSPVWRHWLEELGRTHRVLRYDERGCGLSDREVDDLALEAHVSDLEAVIDAAGLERFALLGISQGGAHAITYATRHPERVSHLILCGCYARGHSRRGASEQQQEENELLTETIRIGWGRPDPVFRRVFTSLFVPGGSAEQMDWFDELERVSTSPEMAVRLVRAWGDIDVTDLLERVAVPTFIGHPRDDLVVPFDEGRLLATRIPDARFLPLESRNHLLLAEEPAWPLFISELRAFLGAAEPPPSADLEDLSPREREVIELVAEGLSNEEIGERLHLSVRTVERHLSNVYAKLRISGKAARAAAAARYSALRR